jgi:hypothetical protein
MTTDAPQSPVSIHLTPEDWLSVALELRELRRHYDHVIDTITDEILFGRAAMCAPVGIAAGNRSALVIAPPEA